MFGKVKKLISFTLTASAIFIALCSAASGNDLVQDLVQWLESCRKNANQLVGTVSEVCEDKVVVSVSGKKPKSGTELIVYSQRFGRNPMVYPQSAVIKVEQIGWNEIQGRILSDSDEPIKKGDIVRFPPVATLFMIVPEEFVEDPSYKHLLAYLAARGFPVVEGDYSEDFPYGYIVKVGISDKIETIEVLSVFDYQIFFLESLSPEQKHANHQ